MVNLFYFALLLVNISCIITVVVSQSGELHLYDGEQGEGIKQIFYIRGKGCKWLPDNWNNRAQSLQVVKGGCVKVFNRKDCGGWPGKFKSYVYVPRLSIYELGRNISSYRGCGV